jgi:hypothetical protein
VAGDAVELGQDQTDGLGALEKLITHDRTGTVA